MKEIIDREFIKAKTKIKSALDKKGYIKFAKRYGSAYAKLYESLDRDGQKLLESLDGAKESSQNYILEKVFRIGFIAGQKCLNIEEKKDKNSLDGKN